MFCTVQGAVYFFPHLRGGGKEKRDNKKKDGVCKYSFCYTSKELKREMAAVEKTLNNRVIVFVNFAKNRSHGNHLGCGNTGSYEKQSSC